MMSLLMSTSTLSSLDSGFRLPFVGVMDPVRSSRIDEILERSI